MINRLLIPISNADTNAYTNPFLGRRVYRPVSSRGYKTFVSASLRVSSSSGDHRAIKSHKFVAFKSGRLNGYQNGFAFIEGDLVG